MGLINSLKRRAAIRRIVNAMANSESMHEETFPAPYFSASDPTSAIAAYYSDDMIYRIDAYQKHSGRYYPQLANDLMFEAQGIPSEDVSPGITESRLTWIETLTPIYKKVESEYENHLERGHGNTLRRSNTVMDNMILFLLSEGKDSTPEQQHALMSIAYLKLQQQEKYVFLPRVMRTPTQPSIEGWITVQALARPTEVKAIFAEYLARRRRHSLVTLRVRSIFDDVPDQLCDYPDELIDQIVKIKSREDSWSLYMMIENRLLHDGATEDDVRELLYFAPLLGMDPRNSEKFIMSLSNYEELPRYKRYSQAPQLVRDQCLALLLVTDALIDLSRTVSAGNDPRRLDGLKIADKRLIRLLLDNPSQGARIAGVIRERGTDDLEVIVAATSNVLSEGFL